MLRKEKFKRETESLLIQQQDKPVRINHIKARIDKTPQNSKCGLCGDRDETINHIISECSKLAQKEYKTRHDWVGKGIHWMCKKFKFNHTKKMVYAQPTICPRKWHINSYGSLTYPRITYLARRPDLIIINKKKRTAKLSTLLSRLITE